jgi:hypothetical protein
MYTQQKYRSLQRYYHEDNWGNEIISVREPMNKGLEPRDRGIGIVGAATRKRLVTENCVL